MAFSRVLGLVRMSLFSRLVGAGALADAFSVAFRIPNLLRDLLAEGALSSAFVPTFTAAVVDGDHKAAEHLARLTTGAVLLVSGGLTLLGLVYAEQVVLAITDGWSPDKIAFTSKLTRIMMPLLTLVSLGAVWMGMLNSQRRFAIPALAPALFNGVSIIVGVALILLGLPGPDAVMAWSVGTLVAGACQCAIQLPPLMRMGYRPWPQFRGLTQHPGVRRIVRLMLPAVAGVAAVQLNIFVNTRFAASLGDGPVAQIEYAFRIFFLPIGMFGVALATVTTTSVSEEAAKGDRVALIHRTRDGVRAVWLLTAASATGLAVLAQPVVELLYEGGAFTHADTLAVAAILMTYLVGLVPYSMVKVVAPAFYSIDRPRLPLMASVTAVAVNIAFNALTYRQLGAPGLALGTSLAAIVNALILRIAFRNVIGPMGQSGQLREHVWLLTSCGVMAGIVVAGLHGYRYGLAHLVGWAPGVQTYATALLALALVLLIGIGFWVYTAILRRVGYPGAEALARLPGVVLRRLRRR